MNWNLCNNFAKLAIIILSATLSTQCNYYCFESPTYLLLISWLVFIYDTLLCLEEPSLTPWSDLIRHSLTLGLKWMHNKKLQFGSWIWTLYVAFILSQSSIKLAVHLSHLVAEWTVIILNLIFPETSHHDSITFHIFSHYSWLIHLITATEPGCLVK